MEYSLSIISSRLVWTYIFTTEKFDVYVELLFVVSLEARTAVGLKDHLPVDYGSNSSRIVVGGCVLVSDFNYML